MKGDENSTCQWPSTVVYCSAVRCGALGVVFLRAAVVILLDGTNTVPNISVRTTYTKFEIFFLQFLDFSLTHSDSGYIFSKNLCDKKI